LNSKQKPHYDKDRRTPEGEWMTACRLLCGLRQSDMAAVLASIDPGLGNQGRPSEFETGKRRVPPEIVQRLHVFFRERLGSNCPHPPAASE
jgi:hypothetical protein